MAKQKPAQAKKGSKGKPARSTAVKEVKSDRKRAAAPKSVSKPAAGKPTTGQKKSAPAAKQTPPKKAAAQRTAPPSSLLKAGATAKAAKPAEKPDKASERGIVTKAVMTKAAGPKETVKPGKAGVKRVAPAAVKAKLPPKPAVPRIASNGQVAGVLQAARSVASRATKVVEVEKERKSHLTAEELAEFRQVLLDKRRELVDDMVNLEDEARRTGTEGGSASSAMPIHMADLGSDTWEQEFTLNLIEKERTIVREIDEALDRIEKKTYGTCLATGKTISKARLRVKPWAKYCIEYARKRELGLT